MFEKSVINIYSYEVHLLTNRSDVRQLIIFRCQGGVHRGYHQGS